ncbi:MAG TPA: hypothetical protein VFD82_12190 [Planctomycetota bacterium]|nr:hypothetical protein [Planctomycetota bacterium]
MNMLPCLSLTALLFATPAFGQVVMGRFGFVATGQLGTAGEFCWVFDCTPRQLSVVAGETLTLRINAPYQAFYAIGWAPDAPNCVPIPGFNNSLILGLPIGVLTAGFVSQQSPILACWGGTEQVLLPLPNGVPSGASVALQAIADLPSPTPSTLSFSVAVVLTVQ